MWLVLHVQVYNYLHPTNLQQVGGFLPGTPISSNNKTDRHDITEILLKMALNTITLAFTLRQTINQISTFIKKNYKNMDYISEDIKLYFSPYHITILFCSIYDFNKLITYLFWSLKKTINFFRCSWLTNTNSVRRFSCDIFVLRVMVFNQQILPS